MVIKLHIKEDNRGFEKKVAHNPNKAKANFVKHDQSSKFKKANNKGKDTKLGPKGGSLQKAKVPREMLQLWESRSQIF